jgi:hypothetical protein
VESQLGPLLIDLVNEDNETIKQRSVSTQKRKAKEMADATENLGCGEMKRSRDSGEEEVRQGRKTFCIVGTVQEGFSLSLQIKGGVAAGRLRLTELEEEDPLDIQASASESQIWEEFNNMQEPDLWESIDFLLNEQQYGQMDVDNDPGGRSSINLLHRGNMQDSEGMRTETQLREETEELKEKDPWENLEEAANNHQDWDSPTQCNNRLDMHQDSLDRYDTDTCLDLTQIGSKCGGRPVEIQSKETVVQSGTVPPCMTAGQEEGKEEAQQAIAGKKRRRRRRSQVADLLAEAVLPIHEKRLRSAVDYTPTLDKEQTKISAKDICTLQGTRHQNWKVGYARSTINKVLAPGQDAGYGLFATSRIETNEIICTYEGAPVDYEDAIQNRYRSHYLLSCPVTKRAIDAADFNSCYGRLACDPVDKALYNAICWSHTIPMVLRAITPINPCYEIFWFYGDTFPWPSELLQLRARQLVLDQGWAVQVAQEEEEEEQTIAAPTDITESLGNDFVLLPVSEIRYTYQNPSMSIEQLHDWPDKVTYADTAGSITLQATAKGRKRNRGKQDTPMIQSPTDARRWAGLMTGRLRRVLRGPWIRIPTASQRHWPVAFATDQYSLEAGIGVVLTKAVKCYEVICDWEGKSTIGTPSPKCYDPEIIYDHETGVTFRLSGLSYGPWVGDSLLLDQYNAVHVWIPQVGKYVTVALGDLSAGTGVYAPKGYLHWQYHMTKASDAKRLYEGEAVPSCPIVEQLLTGQILGRIHHTKGPIDDIGMNVLAWTMSQLQGNDIVLHSENQIGNYDWERLLRWKGKGPDTRGVELPALRVVSLTDAWIWSLYYPPCESDPYRNYGWLLELPTPNRLPLGIGLDEMSNLCAFFTEDVPCGTVIEQLDGDYLTVFPSEVNTYHPYYYPDINLNLLLDVTTAGGSALRYAQDFKQWHRYNACYIYRYNQLHLITIRHVERGERLTVPKGASHWQGHEEGLLYEFANWAHASCGRMDLNIAERFQAIRHYKMETGMGNMLLPYQEWTTYVLQLCELLSIPKSDQMDYDMMCQLYFRFEKGIGLDREGQGVCDVLRKYQRAYPPFGPD